MSEPPDDGHLLQPARLLRLEESHELGHRDGDVALVVEELGRFAARLLGHGAA